MSTRRPILGEMAPTVNLVDFEGRPWTLAEHRGSAVVLIFHRHIH